MEKKNPKPICKLTGTNGNVFALGGKVRTALAKKKLTQKSKEFTTRLFKCHSYGEAVELMMEYVEVR